jgi:hypothetical protein
MAVRETVGRLIAAVYAGKLHPRIAAGLAALMNLQLRAIETTDLEQRMVRIEKLLAKSEAEADAGTEADAAPQDALQDTGEARPPWLDPET